MSRRDLGTRGLVRTMSLHDAATRDEAGARSGRTKLAVGLDSDDPCRCVDRWTGDDGGAKPRVDGFPDPGSGRAHQETDGQHADKGVALVKPSGRAARKPWSDANASCCSCGGSAIGSATVRLDHDGAPVSLLRGEAEELGEANGGGLRPVQSRRRERQRDQPALRLIPRELAPAPR